MKTLDQIKVTFCKTGADPVALSLLLNDAIALIEFELASKAFVQKRLTDANAQIVRQVAMIENLEKTLFKR
jgi:hypothetical protein